MTTIEGLGAIYNAYIKEACELPRDAKHINAFINRWRDFMEDMGSHISYVVEDSDYSTESIDGVLCLIDIVTIKLIPRSSIRNISNNGLIIRQPPQI